MHGTLLKAQRRYGVAVDNANNIDQLVALTRSVYPAMDIGELSYLNWQYERNPAGRALIKIALIKNQVAGQYVVIPMRFNHRDRTVNGSLSVNTITHPDHRGKGIFMILADAVYQQCAAGGIEMTLGSPNDNSFKGFITHLDFKNPGNVPLWLRPLQANRLIKQNSARLPRALRPWIRAAAPLADKWFRRPSVSGGQTAIAEASGFGDAFDALWKKASRQSPWMTVRDTAFLRWRFKELPTRRYRIWAYQEKNELRGYVITRTMEIEGTRCGLIADILVDPNGDTAAVASALVERALDVFLEEDALLAAAMMLPHSLPATGLRKNRFSVWPKSVFPREFPVIVRSHANHAELAEMSDLNNWYLTFGDFDVA